MPQISDSVPLTSHRTKEGYLVGEVRAGRVGIQKYAGAEIGRPDLSTVNVYRPEDEVFKDEAMASFTSLPVTLDHPPDLVSSKTWKHFAVGFTGERVARDGGFLVVPLALKDEASIAQVENKQRQELSFGYTCDLDFTPGQTPDGEKYDAVQRNIRGNHLAIVSAGRAGRDCRIGDHSGELVMADNLRTVAVDGIPVQTTDTGAAVIDTLQKRVGDHVAANLKLTADHTAAITTKDAEIADLKAQLADKDKEAGAKDAEIATLKQQVAQIGDTANIDRLAAERAEVITKAQALDATFDAAGKSNADIRKAVVQKLIGDAAVTNRSDDYVTASFDRLCEMHATTGGAPRYGQNQPTQDAFQRSMQTPPAGSGAPGTQGREAAFNQMLADNSAAWQRTGTIRQN